MTNTTRPVPRSRPVARSGVMIIEVITVAVVIALLIAIIVPTVTALARAEALRTQHALAVEEVRNVLERVVAEHAAGTFDPASLTNAAIDDRVASRLGDVGLTKEFIPVTEPPGQRVTVTLQYGPDGARSVTLSTWLWEETP